MKAEAFRTRSKQTQYEVRAGTVYLLVCTTRLAELERPDATYVKLNPIQYSEPPLSPQLSTSQRHHGFCFFFHDPTLGEGDNRGGSHSLKR